MHIRMEAIVCGRVQMVMYRDFAQRKARGLKLTGEVQNLKDGTVRVVVEGPKERLEAYLTKLRGGPILADVEGIKPLWSEATGTYQGFQITYVR